MRKVFEGLAVLAIVLLIGFAANTSQASDGQIAISIAPLSLGEFEVTIDLDGGESKFGIQAESAEDAKNILDEELEFVFGYQSKQAQEDSLGLKALDGQPVR